MEFIEVDTYNELSRRAANIIAAEMILNKKAVLGLATGSTPIGVYNRLIELNLAGDIDFSNIRTINLDEYCGISPENPNSYRFFMNENLFGKVNIKKENTHIPNGNAENLNAECERYNTLIENLGGIDVQLLGIGKNGHIGFNEPNTSFRKGTHVIELKESTRIANSRFFESLDFVPKSAITVGIHTIMNAKRIILIANGKEKKEILDKAFSGGVTPEIPASILALHPNLTVIYSKE
ncbi:MAG: glucosamine-6-phosphate deaminase [Clostridia bacterium]|nr:glucosamine-6-phosphate deaminase [Clostridia bacterium]